MPAVLLRGVGQQQAIKTFVDHPGGCFTAADSVSAWTLRSGAPTPVGDTFDPKPIVAARSGSASRGRTIRDLASTP
jgi:hypothetical protein